MHPIASRFWLYALLLVGAATLPAGSSHAASATVIAGQTVTLTSSVLGDAPFTYQWYKDSVAVSGATNSTYSMASFQVANAGTYTVVITNAFGSTTSDEAVLTLATAAIAPVFTTQPVGLTVSVGSSVTFTSVATGLPTPTYQWMKNGSAIVGATSASYTISSPLVADAGLYTVVATNSAGAVTSNVATLAVNVADVLPAFTTQPASQTVTVGTSVTFTSVASGIPTPTYQWRKNGTAIAGATNASYTISSPATGDAGTYTVVATNLLGSATSNDATLTVNTAGAAPAFTTHPASQTVTAGGSVTFTAAASGSPTPTYQWRKNGTAITGATSASYTIASTATGNAGTYTVVATNSAGSATSNSATLTVNTLPAFTTQPSSQMVMAGTSVTFTAAASGTPAPTYQWRKNGTAITGATSASYTIASPTTSSAGTYTVVATNSVGSATSSSATLAVNTMPVFTTQPTSQSVAFGTSVTFTAAASGSPTPTFQWRKNGTAITGATSASYTIASVTSGSAGTYTVVATNTAGPTTSNSATLTVAPAIAPSNVVVTFAVE